MALKVGITGGIGVGKSLVCRIFKVLGIPVFNADAVAKTIMEDDAALRSALVAAFGENSYGSDGKLDRGYLAKTVFNDEKKLKQLNALVHPAVIRAGEEWAALQSSPYTIKEAALLFESGSYKLLDYSVLVTAPETLRIARVMTRDSVSEEQVRSRMAKQLPDEQKIPLADFVVVNDGSQSLIQQVIQLHRYFLSI